MFNYLLNFIFPGIDLQTSLKRLQAQDEIFKLSNVKAGFEEAITRFSTEPESGSEINEEDEEEIEEDFGVQIESPVWRKEDANFWND